MPEWFVSVGQVSLIRQMTIDQCLTSNFMSTAVASLSWKVHSFLFYQFVDEFACRRATF